jgi:hypothetical protein
MRNELQFCLVRAMLVALLAACTSCGQRQSPNTTGANSISNKLAAITQAGQPVTTKELNDWYPAPPNADNAAELYAQAFAALTQDDPKTPAFLARNQSAVQLLLQAAERKSCRYPVDFSAGFSTELPHLKNIKKCAILLEAEAAAQASQGHTDRSTKAVLAGLRLARSLENEPMPMSQVIRFVAERSALSGLERAITHKAFTGDELVSLQTALRNTGGPEPFAHALAGERCAIIAIFKAPLKEMIRSLFGTEAQVADYQKRPIWQEDFNFALDCYVSLVAAAEKPFPEAFAGIADFDKRMEGAKAKGLLLSLGTLSGMKFFFTKAGEATARIRVAQMALAVERHRLKHGNVLPNSLDVVVPELIESVLIDPFGGEPLRYEKLADGGYVVYSVGKDQMDDHGAAAPAGVKDSAPPDITFAVRR